MTAQAAATTVDSVEAPDSIAPRLDPAEAWGTLTILVEVTVTTTEVGTGRLVDAGSLPDDGVITGTDTDGVTDAVYVSVTGTEIFVEPPGVGAVWK
jgi:hypothetical protein